MLSETETSLTPDQFLRKGVMNSHFGTRHGIIMLTIGSFLEYLVKARKVIGARAYRIPASTFFAYFLM